MGDREDIFDDKLRSLMENAEESVPKRVWSGLSKRLADEGLQKAKPVVIPLWTRWSAVGIAIAAAIILGIFLFMRGGEWAGEEVFIAEVVDNEDVSVSEAAINEEISAAGAITGGSESGVSVAGTGVSEAGASVAGTGVSAEEAVEGVSESGLGVAASGDALGSDDSLLAEVTEAAASDEGAENSLAEQIASAPKYIAEAGASESWTDPFDGKTSNRSSNKVHAALTVSGDAFGNVITNSSSSTGIRRQMASNIEDQLTPGIRESSDPNYGIPATFGLGVKIMFTHRWSLGVGVNYSMLSRTFSGIYTSYNAAGDLFSENYSNIRHRVDYIGIPVNAYFSIIQSHAVDFYVYAGGTIEKAVSSRYILEHGVPSYKESVKGVQCSTDVGIGVEFIVVDWLGIYVDPNLRYYFPNSHQPNSIRTQEPLNFGFEIGLRFRLQSGKKN